jgi:glutamyl-tRNA reductase
MEKAQVLAGQSGSVAVPFWQMPEILAQADVCISSSACPHYLIDRDIVERSMRQRPLQKLVCIDISMPRNIDPKVAEVKNVCLAGIDDLDRALRGNMQKRLSAARQVEKIIFLKAQEYTQAMNKVFLYSPS